MTVNHPDALLAQVAETLKSKTGLRFHTDRRGDLRRAIASAAREMGFCDWQSLALWLLDAPLLRRDIETLARHLTVGETYFRRDQKIFDFFEQTILPEIASMRRPQRRLRIWSAGCSTGEEPYSIAISVQRAVPDWKEWNLTLLATDIHLRLVERAREGIYRQWSFRNCPDWLKQLYFTRKDSDFEIAPAIREMVSFDYLNLAEDIYPSLFTGTNAMDVIFCRNVLMYFDAEAAQKAIDSFHRSLVDGGWLVAGATDAPSSFYSRFEPVRFQGATLYRKSDRKTKPKPADFSKKEIRIPAPPVVRQKNETREKKKIPVVENPLEVARRFYDEGRYDEAIDALEESLSCGLPLSEAMTLAARARANQGRLREAREWCEKALVRDKLDPSIHYLLAVITEEEGNPKSAIAALNRALYIDPDFVMAHFKLAGLKARTGRSSESRKHFQCVMSLLTAREGDEILPESEGITVGRLKAIIQTIADESGGAI